MFGFGVKDYRFEPETRKTLNSKYRKLLKSHKIKLKKKGISDHYFDEPIDEHAILISGIGRNVRGSMQYLLDELNRNDDYKDFRIYVRVSPENTEETVKGFIEKNGWSRTETISEELDRLLETCKYLVTESYFPYTWIRRPGQVMIDLWHGTPLKRLGVLKNGRKAHKQAIQQKNFLCADYLLYPNEFTRGVMWDSYRITSLLQAKALMMGYPRTSGILKVTPEEAAEIHRELAPNGEKVYAYMPTFRGYLDDAGTVEKESELLDYLDGQLSDDQILYVNLHPRIKDGIDFSAYKHIRNFPPLIDSYNLLAAADALISDYSSVFFDYLVTRKQIILYIEDHDRYVSYQGLNMDIEELPFDLARTKEQIPEMLNRGKQYDDTELFKSLCAYDAADNPEKMCRLFLGDESGLHIEEIPSNDKKKILVYAETIMEGRDRAILEKITEEYDTGTEEIYLGVDEKKVNADKKPAYPLLHNRLVLDSMDGMAYSSIGSPLLKLYKSGKVSFKEAFRFLHYEYALVSRRMYGDVVFDAAVIFDALKPETVLGLALSESKQRILYIGERMAQAIDSGNTFLKDAIRFSAPYCSEIVVSSKENADRAAGILRFADRRRVKVIDSAEELRELILKTAERSRK